MIAAKLLATCLLLAAETQGLPPAVLIGIMDVEGGRVGQQVGPNNNGTYDLGPMQVNSLWIPELAEAWGVDHKKAYRMVRDDGCVNVKVSAWILRKKIKEAGSLYGGIAHYHSATPGIGTRYAAKVIRAMDRRGLIKRRYAKGETKTYYAKR